MCSKLTNTDLFYIISRKRKWESRRNNGTNPSFEASFDHVWVKMIAVIKLRGGSSPGNSICVVIGVNVKSRLVIIDGSMAALEFISYQPSGCLLNY